MVPGLLEEALAQPEPVHHVQEKEKGEAKEKAAETEDVKE